MSKYTVELGNLAKSGFKVFDFTYDFYDPTKKTDFEQKFINHFYFREIGTETPAKFRHYLACKCSEILPLYNEMLKVVAMEYDLINNYNLTETFNKTNSGTRTNTGDTSNTINRTADIVDTGEKTNTLDSETTHTEETTFNRTGVGDENSTLDNISTVDTDNKKVGSDTPNGLLSMEDITNNVYASNADIEDGTTKTVDDQATTAHKTENTTETTTSTINDSVDATSHDSTTNTHDETIKETNAGTVSQNENSNGTENYTLQRVGNIGVDAPSDMLRKHIEFQKTIRTAYAQFFDECEDLFMQLY